MPGPLRILVIDNDPALCRVLTHALAIDGHAAASASSGEHALAMFKGSLARGEPFHVVVTDLAIGGVDGTAVATTVRALAPRTFLILLVADGTERQAMPSVNRTLPKPCTPDQLRHAIRGLAKRHNTTMGR